MQHIKLPNFIKFSFNPISNVDKDFTGSIELNTDNDIVIYHYLNGILHREGAPAIVYSNGSYSYYKHGELHRKDGPAECYNKGTHVLYYLEGKLHRIDGPASIDTSTRKKEEVYYIDGTYICKNNEDKFYNSKEYKRWILLQSMKSIKNIT